MIFLDLQKVYDALDRSRCLEILEGYSATPELLEAPHDGGASGRILRDCFQVITRGDTGRSAFPHHF